MKNLVGTPGQPPPRSPIAKEDPVGNTRLTLQDAIKVLYSDILEQWKGAGPASRADGGSTATKNHSKVLGFSNPASLGAVPGGITFKMGPLATTRDALRHAGPRCAR